LKLSWRIVLLGKNGEVVPTIISTNKFRDIVFLHKKRLQKYVGAGKYTGSAMLKPSSSRLFPEILEGAKTLLIRRCSSSYYEVSYTAENAEQY